MFSKINYFKLLINVVLKYFIIISIKHVFLKLHYLLYNEICHVFKL